MTRGPRSVGGVLRGGRLLDTGAGLRDLATGLPATLTTRVLSEAAALAWRAPAFCSSSRLLADTGDLVVDAWLALDLLGRWVEKSIRVPRSSFGASCADAPACARWLASATRGRAEGLVPIHTMCVGYLRLVEPSAGPPLLVGVPEDRRRAPPPGDLLGWVRAGGRCASLVPAPPLAADPSQAVENVDRWASPLDRGVAERVRHLRRTWSAMARGPSPPRHAIRGAGTRGGANSMTHLELLDVSTQLEEVRQDAEALALGCRTARQHMHADHIAVLSRQDDGIVVIASDGAAGDSAVVWPHLCATDAPAALVSPAGWHAVARQSGQDSAFWLGGRWASAARGTSAPELLAVFARLVAPRVPRPAPVAPGLPGLEDTLVGDSVVMRDVRAQIALAARAPFPVLIRGESGCGKELAARAIHALGLRRHRRCAAINCAALPDDLIESELFGHVRGAFTGAATDRAGLFDEADGGTLFLDEVGELGGRAQAKLLRVLQDGEVRRVGENHARRVDVRVIAATNVSLEDAVRRGQFRADLFYRLDVVRVRMPALRERREDVPMLARHFWRECTARVGSRARLEGRVLDALARYDWPGNVRQLQNTLAALSVRVPVRGRVALEDLPPELRGVHAGDAGTRGGLEAARREFEASYVREALSRAGGRPTMAARDLGVTRQGLSKLVRRLGLDAADAGPRLP